MKLQTLAALTIIYSRSVPVRMTVVICATVALCVWMVTKECG